MVLSITAARIIAAIIHRFTTRSGVSFLRKRLRYIRRRSADAVKAIPG